RCVPRRRRAKQKATRPTARSTNVGGPGAAASMKPRDQAANRRDRQIGDRRLSQLIVIASRKVRSSLEPTSPVQFVRRYCPRDRASCPAPGAQSPSVDQPAVFPKKNSMVTPSNVKV